jgi:hypothetical protein
MHIYIIRFSVPFSRYDAFQGFAAKDISDDEIYSLMAT